MKINFKDVCGKDNLEKLRNASELLKQENESELFIEPGIYEITGAAEKQLFSDVIEKKYGENPQSYLMNPNFCNYTRALDLCGQNGTRVYAEGATFLFDGFFEPISIRNCENITLSGLTIDYKRKPFSRGEILSFERKEKIAEMRVRFREEMPDSFNYLRSVVYDKSIGVSHCNPFRIEGIERIAGREFLLRASGAEKDVCGNDLYIWHFFHSRPAILLQNSRTVRLNGITVHSHPGMGVVGHLSRDIFINGLSVIPSCGDAVSTNTDATHFASCYGKLEMRNCVFDGQGDDSVNVHTYYHSAEKIGYGSYRLTCLASDGAHTAAADCPCPGDKMQLFERGTLNGGNIFTVEKAYVESGGTVVVKLNDDVGFPIDGFYFANVSACPDFLFSRCRARNHFARSVLIKTKNAIVENCIFEHTNETAVVVSAEEFWGEGISTENVEIKNNVFLNCSMKGNGASAVAVFTNSKEESGIQHGAVRVENNLIVYEKGKPTITICNTENATVRGNFEIEDDEAR